MESAVREVTPWVPTKTVNKYTGARTNEQCYVDNKQCLVFRARWGWRYTVRVQMIGGRWLQISSITWKYYDNVELAKLAALACVADIEAMTTIVPSDADEECA